MTIELKEWTIEDKESLMEISNAVDRTYLSNRLPYPYTEENAVWWITNIVQEKEGKSGIFRSISVDGKIVGNISVEKKEDIFEKDGEIGFMLAPEGESKGIMTEAVSQLCKIAFEELELERITGRVFAPNIASQKVLEKCGFQLEGTMRRAVIKNGEIFDLYCYGKLK